MLSWPYVRSRYYLENRRPSQTTSLTIVVKSLLSTESRHHSKDSNLTCVWFQLALKWLNSCLCCTSNRRQHYETVVKVYRVFSSYCWMPASSRACLFRRSDVGDSGGIITLFMHVETYATRNFATLRPSRLQPPLEVGWIQCLHISFYLTPLGKRQTISILFRVYIVLCFW